jgi:hypothetical protein
MKSFIKHRPTVLDKLPLDSIKLIASHLDYDSRINLNICLPRWDRIRKRMPPKSVLAHDINMRISTLSVRIRRLDDMVYTDDGSSNGHLNSKWAIIGIDRILSMTTIFKYLQNPLYFIIVKKFPRFRNALKAKLATFSEELEHLNPGLFPESFKEQFAIEMTKVKDLLEAKESTFSNENFKLGSIPELNFA